MVKKFGKGMFIFYAINSYAISFLVEILLVKLRYLYIQFA